MQILRRKELITFTNLISNEYLQVSTIYIIALLVPFIISKPQILTGSIVNFLLVYTTLKYGIKKSIYLSLIPSASAVLNGLLFGSITIFLTYLIPFIIISNTILIISVGKYKNLFGTAMGSVLKAVFLFSVTNILINTINLPQTFIYTMGYMQLITATIGSISALVIYKNFNKIFKS